tara:strand:- start:2122 stop:2706 length:585 start_codon:yes stop_codon:yes gene_type:complete
LKSLDLSTKHTDGTVVMDLEADGLLLDATTIHCIVLYWVESDRTEVYNDEPYAPNSKFLPMASGRSITSAITELELAQTIIGHNIVGYDLPLIKRLYPYFNPAGDVIDTLILSRLYHPNRLELDRKRWKDMPSNLKGKHSLEAYGYRLNEHKGNFGKQTDWKVWSQEMQDYCIQDVVVTKKLCNHFHPYLSGSN